MLALVDRKNNNISPVVNLEVFRRLSISHEGVSVNFTSNPRRIAWDTGFFFKDVIQTLTAVFKLLGQESIFCFVHRAWDTRTTLSLSVSQV